MDFLTFLLQIIVEYASNYIILFQTPAMVELITDHIWTMKELMTWRAPIQ